MSFLSDVPSFSGFWDSDDEILGLRLPTTPIFHYTNSVSAVKSIVSSGELWFSKSTVMNDFAEIQYGLDLLNEVIIERIPEDEMYEPLLHMIDEILGNAFGDIFICSFSENGDSRLLWDSYSRKNGYSIEFNPYLISHLCEKSGTVIGELVDGQWRQTGEELYIKILTENYRQGITHPFEYQTFANRVSYNE